MLIELTVRSLAMTKINHGYSESEKGRPTKAQRMSSANVLANEAMLVSCAFQVQVVPRS